MSQRRNHAHLARRSRPQQHRLQPDSFAVRVLTGAIFAGMVGWIAAPIVTGHEAASKGSVEQVASIERSAYFRGCNEARAAGVAPLRRGQPGYREGMDGDGDGVACEDYRGW